MTALVARTCLPCQGGVPPLEAAQSRRLLEELGPGWQVKDGHHLTKTWLFDDFAAALAWVNRLGELAEAEGHHPDVHLSCGRVRVDIWTHAIDGLTESDFILAAKTNQIA